MLVLTRKIQEQVLIGDNIKITVLRVKGNSIRLGIEAPRDVRVMRAELPLEKRQPQPTATSGAENLAPVPSETPEALGADSTEESDEAGVSVRCPPLAGFIANLEASAV